MWLRAAQASGPPSLSLPLDPWVQYGVLGMVVLAIILGYLVPYKAHRREQERADRLETEVDRLRQVNEDRMLPLLARALDVLERAKVDRRGDRAGDV